MIHLLFGVHAHQPIGNFPDVIERARERSYRPFLQTLSRFPDFRFSVHFSGWLLDCMSERYPEDIELLQQMVARGQVEIFGSGWAEPVLAAIPHRDRIGQIEVMSAQLERLFKTRPVGAWLTERVWESSVVPALVETGIRYVTVDDYHFLCTGKAARELDGFYTTEESGVALDVFPISEELRYRLPFSTAPEAVAYIERLADEGHAAAIYFDDIEKFGIWPETWEWVYEKRWLEQFVRAVLASPKIRTATYREFHAGAKSRGIIYLPTASYIEMNEWTLPVTAARTYAALVREHKDAQRYRDTKAFLRGGIWRNFLARYPEANWMHKRMLALSGRLAELHPEKRPGPRTMELYCAQANDGYWHGLFGGLYLPHLRRAVYRELLKLERELDRLAPRATCERKDLDLDGAAELFLRTPDLQAVSRDDGLGAVHELASYALAYNFADTLRRGAELYYDKIAHGSQQSQASGGIASAHDRVAFLHSVTAEDVIPDPLPRVVFLDRYGAGEGNAQAITSYAFDGFNAAHGTLVFRAALGGGLLHKRYQVAGSRLSVRYRFERVAAATFATELNLSFPACDGFGGRYILADGSIPCGFGQDLVQSNVTKITFDDRELGGAIQLTSSVPLGLRAAPHYTVSQSEAGFEKVMQAATITLSWPLTAATSEVAIDLVVSAGQPPG